MKQDGKRDCHNLVSTRLRCNRFWLLFSYATLHVHPFHTVFLLCFPHYLVTVPSIMQSMWNLPDNATQNMMAVTPSKQWIHFFLSDLWPPTSNILLQKNLQTAFSLNAAITLDTICHLRVSQTHCFINSICFCRQTKNFLICPTERASFNHGNEWNFNQSTYFTKNMWNWWFYKITKLNGKNDNCNTYITSTINFINSPKASGDIHLSLIIQMKYIFSRNTQFLFS